MKWVFAKASWLLGFVCLSAVLFGPGLIDFIHLSLDQKELDQQLATLSAEHEKLAEEFKRIESDPIYVEGLIRSTFKVAQPGEFVIPPESKSVRPIEARR